MTFDQGALAAIILLFIIVLILSVGVLYLGHQVNELQAELDELPVRHVRGFDRGTIVFDEAAGVLNQHDVDQVKNVWLEDALQDAIDMQPAPPASAAGHISLMGELLGLHEPHDAKRFDAGDRK